MQLRPLIPLFLFIMSVSITANSQVFKDRHSTNLDDGWLSCQSSENPNAKRVVSHWIKYDLGDTYALTTSTIWNFNTPERINSYNNESWSLVPLQGKLEDGMKDVIIDISINGTEWQEWGRFSIPKASGSSFYQGVAGPDFGGKIARYVLITGVNNHGGSCFGLGELRINGTIATVSHTVDLLAQATIKAEPNPFSDMTVIKLQSFPAGTATITLSDLTGKKVREWPFVFRQDLEEWTMSGSDLTSGLYFLQVTQNEATKTLKIEVLK